MLTIAAAAISFIIYTSYCFYRYTRLYSSKATRIGISNDSLCYGGTLIKQEKWKIVTGYGFHVRSFLKELYSLFFPSEIIAIAKMKFGGNLKKEPKNSLDELAKRLNDREFCYATLDRVSRSFALVIQQLPQSLKDCVCIFYLVLRGLDSIEDDMTISCDEKLALLRNFHKNLLIDNWSMKNIGDTEDYRTLLAHFGKVISALKSLRNEDQLVISEIARRMGAGMAEYVGKTGSIETIESYNLYCHYVAGLVGHGLSELFAQSGLEDRNLHIHKDLSNSMGLFLQKTNIIRDYLEDLQAGRTWWPKEIWQNYANNLDDFVRNPNDKQSLACLNHMVMDALKHVPDVLDYLGRLKHRKVLEFCAIPQIMAIGTLSELYNNPLVFTSVVKLRKGLTCKIILGSSTMDQVYSWFNLFIRKIEGKMSNNTEVNIDHMRELVGQVKQLSASSTNN